MYDEALSPQLSKRYSDIPFDKRYAIAEAAANRFVNEDPEGWIKATSEEKNDRHNLWWLISYSFILEGKNVLNGRTILNRDTPESFTLSPYLVGVSPYSNGLVYMLKAKAHDAITCIGECWEMAPHHSTEALMDTAVRMAMPILEDFWGERIETFIYQPGGEVPSETTQSFWLAVSFACQGEVFARNYEW